MGREIPTRRHNTLTGESTDILMHTARISSLCAEIEQGVDCGATDAIRAHVDALKREADEVVEFAEREERKRQSQRIAKRSQATLKQEVLI